MVKASTIAADAARLKQSYDATMAQVERAWRRAAMEPDDRRRATLETRAHDLQYRARVLAGTHQRAIKALEQLENE